MTHGTRHGPESLSLSGHSILIVAPDAAAADKLRAALEGAGAEAVWASDAMEVALRTTVFQLCAAVAQRMGDPTDHSDLAEHLSKRGIPIVWYGVPAGDAAVAAIALGTGEIIVALEQVLQCCTCSASAF